MATCRSVDGWWGDEESKEAEGGDWDKRGESSLIPWSWETVSELRCFERTGLPGASEWREVRRAAVRACNDMDGARFTGEARVRAGDGKEEPGLGLIFALDVLEGLAARDEPSERAVLARDSPVLCVR